MDDKERYDQTLLDANVEKKAKYLATWQDPETERSCYSAVTVEPRALRGQLDKINLRSVEMGGKTQHVLLSVADAKASLMPIAANSVNLAFRTVCADDNLEMLYTFDATNKIGKLLDKNRYIPDKLAKYKQMVKEGTEKMLVAELAEANGKKHDREAKSALEQGRYRDLADGQIAKRAKLDHKDAERPVDRLDRVANHAEAAAAALMSITGNDSTDGPPRATPTFSAAYPESVHEGRPLVDLSQEE